ncbi:hypothetical protein [Bartonella raoultii]|uniref:Uncharacterized protein n=1 Tax=Bartonella raoultii TaxID=1457020 RepID=A0ABS7I446_9HYPH|nr:hypothetical protein [Bartonella raoultii]MBX4335519.1 hypothetical protein [Bartonella raoultii]
MTPIVILIAIILFLFLAFWHYFGFKEWAFFPSLLITLGGTTVFFLLAPMDGSCEPARLGRGRTSNLHCIIGENYPNFVYALKEGYAAALVISCLVISIICLCERFREQDMGRDKESDSSKYSNDYSGPWQ